MSWLFGIKKPAVPQDQFEPTATTPTGAPSNSGDDKGKSNAQSAQQQTQSTESQYRFDSAALERAAKAAKDLERSANSKEILDLSRQQERTKQLEYEKQMVEMKTYQEELKLKQTQTYSEERRKLLDDETKHANEVYILWFLDSPALSKSKF
jgi:ATPase family AAA domain-containing protein 3A/B